MISPPLSAFCATLCLTLLTGLSAHADITGTIGYVGDAPRPEVVDMSSDPTCRRFRGKTGSALTVLEGRVANAFVYIVAPKGKFGPPRGRVRLATEACQFSPRILGVRVGQKLEVENKDGTLYSVRVRGGGSSVVRRLPKVGSRFSHRFSNRQVMARASCDVHGWAIAHLGVLEHPVFGVSDPKGAFRLPTAGLLDGTYEIRVWHEVLGEKVGKVLVKDGAGVFDVSLGATR